MQQPFRLLDVYAENGIIEAAPRVDALATISAGEKTEKNGKTFPTRSRDGKIVLHDENNRAPGLAAALALTEDRALTIAFPFDDLHSIIQQRFTEYSASNLLAYGDDREITVLKDGRQTFNAGTPQYLDAVKRCKVTTSVYFHLARWADDGAQVFFPDGLGFYRLRFASRNSLRSIVASLQTTARYMGGRLAGVPFQLTLDNPEVAGPDGSRRKVPVWRCVFAAPQELSLSSQNFRQVATQALAQGAALMLPAPSVETLELAEHEGAEIDLDEVTEGQVEEMLEGGRCDDDHYRRHWFALVKQSPLDSDEARAVFVERYSAANGWAVTTSLSSLLERMNEEQAQTFVLDVQDELDVLYQQALNRYEALLVEAERVGIKRRELPEGATFKTVGEHLASLRAAITRRKAPIDPGGTIEDAEYVSDAPVPPRTLTQAVHQKMVQATLTTPADRADMERIFTPRQAEFVEFVEEQGFNVVVHTDDIVASEDEGGAVPQYVQNVMEHLYENGVAHGGDFAFEPMIAAINDWRARLQSPLSPIQSIASLTERETKVMIIAFNRGDLRIGLV